MRRAAKVDANQPEIVKTFRAMMCSVQHTHMIGEGFPDVIIATTKNGPSHLIEIKDGDKPPSKRKLTRDEQKWHDEWLGNVHIVETPAQAEDLVNKLRRAGL
jgi:hypothetical protein